MTETEATRDRQVAVLRRRVADVSAFVLVITLVALLVIAGWWGIVWLLTNPPHS